MYFLLLSVQTIVIMMKAQTFEKFEKDKKKWTRIKTFIYVLYFVLGTTIISLNIFDAFNEEVNKTAENVRVTIEITVKVVIFAIDIFMSKIFVEMILFYNQQTAPPEKKQKIMRTSLNQVTASQIEDIS